MQHIGSIEDVGLSVMGVVRQGNFAKIVLTTGLIDKDLGYLGALVLGIYETPDNPTMTLEYKPWVHYFRGMIQQPVPDIYVMNESHKNKNIYL